MCVQKHANRSLSKAKNTIDFLHRRAPYSLSNHDILPKHGDEREHALYSMLFPISINANHPIHHRSVSLGINTTTKHSLHAC